MTSDPKCDVCGAVEVVEVAAMPGVPISVAYCHTCLHSGAQPLKIVITNTALVGGYEEAADWWQDIVDVTLDYLKYPRDLFHARVQAEIDDLVDTLVGPLPDVPPNEVYDREAAEHALD